MANKLKNLKITSTDLVDQGANPDAHIRLFKRKTAPDAAPADPAPETLLQKAIAALQGVFGEAPVKKSANTFDEEMQQERQRKVTGQMWDFCYALCDSLSSITWDDELTDDDKRNKMNTSIDQFASTMREAIPLWSAGNTIEVQNDGSVVAKSAALDELLLKYAKAVGGSTNENDTKKSANSQKEETDTMRIDKSKMTPEELTAYEAIEKKYGMAEPEGTTPTAAPADAGNGNGSVAKGAEQSAGETGSAAPDMHPEVKKALADMAEIRKAQTAEIDELKKSLEIKDLTMVAKKYEIIGKKAEELAPKLYDLKKAGGTAYDDFVGLLNEQVTLVEKSALFSEIGTARGGISGSDAKLETAIAEVRKNNSDISSPEAVVKAFENNPEMSAEYDANYMKGRIR
jgi:hypothetical protein